MSIFSDSLSILSIAKARLISCTLLNKLLDTMNSYRFINGSDNPINGICVSRMRPYLCCIFTDDISIGNIDLSLFDCETSNKYGNYNK